MEIVNQQSAIAFQTDQVAFTVTKRNTLTVSLDTDEHKAKACRKLVCLPSVSHWLLNQTARDGQGQHPTATAPLFHCNEGDWDDRENYLAVNVVKSSQQSNKKKKKKAKC